MKSVEGLSSVPFVGIHEGQTIVLMGNAHSLNALPLDLLQEAPHIVTIGCNRILQIFNPTYYVVADRQCYMQEVGRIREYRGARLLSDTLFNAEVNCRGIPVQSRPDFCWFRWSVTTYGMLDSLVRRREAVLGHMHIVETDPRRPLISGANIAYPLLQWAILMGARRIGFVGVDLKWSSPEKAYFFGDGRDNGCRPPPPKATAFHEAAREWLKRNRPQVVVRNLSPVRGVMDDIYGKADFRAFLNLKESPRAQ